MRLRRTITGAFALMALGLLCGAARAETPVEVDKRMRALLASLEGAKAPAERHDLVRSLAEVPSVRAAEHLRKIARTDPDPTLRVEAVQGLGRSPVVEALDMLLELAYEGGPREVRRAVGASIAQRSGATHLLKTFGKTTDDLGRGLLIEALAADASPEAVAALEHMSRGDDPRLRPEALRALSHNTLGATILSSVLADVLKKHQDLDTLLAGLDVIESLDEADLRPLAKLLDSFLDPEVRPAVDAARRRLAWFDAVAASKAAKKAKAEGYGVSNKDYGTSPPDPPPPRPRVDIVFVYDASGSVSGFLKIIKERIRRETQTLTNAGLDVRIGLVAYGDMAMRVENQRWATRVLPLSYDQSRVDPFIDAVSTRGCDSPLTDGLDQALNRMGWRWGAQRQVALIADGKTDDAAASHALVKLHFDSDRTRLRVWYLYRTRVQLPPDVADLAKVGGGTVESLE